MSASFYQVLEKVQKSTENGAVRWEATEVEQAFRLHLGGGTIRIEELNQTEIQVELLSDDKQQITMVSSAIESKPPEFLRDLFLAARKSALGEDLLLDRMNDELDNLDRTNS